MTQIKHTLGKLYEAKTGNHQGLLIEEETGTSTAVVYDKDHAQFIVTACNAHYDLLEALQKCKAAVENGSLPPSARMELVRDYSTPAIAKAQAKE